MGRIAAMGAGTIGIIGGMSVSGTVTTKLYELRTPSVVNYKLVWTFKASTGDNYGPYTSYRAG